MTIFYKATKAAAIWFAAAFVVCAPCFMQKCGEVKKPKRD